MRLMRRFAPLLAIAATATTDEILPGGSSAFTSGEYVVKCRLSYRKLVRAILTFEFITGKDVGSAEWRRSSADSSVFKQPYYCRSPNY